MERVAGEGPPIPVTRRGQRTAYNRLSEEAQRIGMEDYVDGLEGEEDDEGKYVYVYARVRVCVYVDGLDGEDDVEGVCMCMRVCGWVCTWTGWGARTTLRVCVCVCACAGGCGCGCGDVWVGVSVGAPPLRRIILCDLSTPQQPHAPTNPDPPNTNTTLLHTPPQPYPTKPSADTNFDPDPPPTHPPTKPSSADEEEAETEDDIRCYVCGFANHARRLLLCDGEGGWQCVYCILLLSSSCCPATVVVPSPPDTSCADNHSPRSPPPTIPTSNPPHHTTPPHHSMHARRPHLLHRPARRARGPVVL